MLTERLRSILAAIPPGSKVADIGSDHGYLPISLVKRGDPRPIATEHLIGPYQQCLANVQGYNYDVDVRFGDGLEPIASDEVDLVVIAGMSGQTITKILADSLDKVINIPSFILQPMVGADFLRQFIAANQFSFKNEWVSLEGDKFYQFIWMIPQREETFSEQLICAYAGINQETLLNIGPKLLLNTGPLTGQLLINLRNKHQEILARLDPNKHGARYEQVSYELAQLNEVVKCHTKLVTAHS